MRPNVVLRVLVLCAVVSATLVTLFPVYAVLLMAFSHTASFADVLNPNLAELTVRHVVAFMTQSDANGRWLFGRQLFNSFVVSGSATLVGLSLATTAAYALSRMRFPGHRAALSVFLITQMFPATMMIVPLYLVIHALGLVDSVLGLALVYGTTALPFCVWMLKGYIDTIPRDLDEAARVDGASTWRIFYDVILPLCRPALAVTALFSFLSAWNEFILAATFISREEAFTLPVTLYRHVGSYGANWPAFAAGSIVVSVPVCALFLYLQRHLVRGLSAGAVK